MDVLLLSRLQFGLTTVYHFFFVPLTLGLTLMVAVMETLYVRKGDKKYSFTIHQPLGKVTLFRRFRRYFGENRPFSG